MNRPKPPARGSLLNDVVYGLDHDLFDDRIGHSLLRAYSVGAADDVVVGRSSSAFSTSELAKR